MQKRTSDRLLGSSSKDVRRLKGGACYNNPNASRAHHSSQAKQLESNRESGMKDHV